MLLTYIEQGLGWLLLRLLKELWLCRALLLR
jgi:hypothetical protein